MSRAASRFSSARLRRAFVDDLTRAWSTLGETHPDHDPYALVAYGLGCGDADLVPHVLTEQGLTEVAQRYLDEGYYDTLDEARQGLRYSIPDSPLAEDFYDLAGTGAVSALRSRAGSQASAADEPIDDAKTYAVLAEAATAALRQLDERDFFGTGAARERLLLIVIVENGDPDQPLRSAIQLNPPVVAERYQRQTHQEGSYADCSALAVAADGMRLYTAGSVANPQAKPGSRDGFLRQVVAYDLRDARLTRRWVFEFPGWADSIRQLACPGAGGTLFALRCRYIGDVARTFVLRLDVADGRLADEGELPGEPASFAVSADGSRIAVAMHDGLVHLLHDDLRPAERVRVGPRAAGLRFLRGGQLLVATDRGVWQIDPDALEPRRVCPLNAFRLSTDGDEVMLAVSRWVPRTGPEADHPAEFGASVVSLPTFGQIRSFLVPDHQAVTAELSPDGRRLALVAMSLSTVRKHIVVFDTATGRELARRRVDILTDLSFLPDSSALVIPTSGITTGPPLDIWPLA